MLFFCMYVFNDCEVKLFICKELCINHHLAVVILKKIDKHAVSLNLLYFIILLFKLTIYPSLFNIKIKLNMLF